MERQKFEESFRDAFRDAEIAPSEAVWANVELVLEKNAGGKMKGRLIFFQLLAAASLVFAMGVGGIYYLNTTHNFNQTNTVAKQKTEQPLVSSSERLPEEGVSKVMQKQERPPVNTRTNSSSVIQASSASTDHDLPTESRQSIPLNDPLVMRDRKLPALTTIELPVFVSAKKEEPDPGMVLLARMKDEERRYQQDAKKSEFDEKLWTSVGVGVGSFNPNATTGTSVLTSLSGGGSSATSDPSSGSSYSVGISLATKLADRVVFQGGISYMSQNAEFTSSAALPGNGAALNEFVASEDRLVATSPYRVSSNLQFMSIPVQAGYILIDRQFAMQVNGGVSTDIFFQSTLTPEHNDLTKVSQDAGTDSPYRTLNFSGLLGTEFSYKVGEHYRVAVNPGLRYAFNSIYKSEVAVETAPVTFDVALRFRYIFK
ncbi:MAG: outer membrane beta-barrel protein [Cyclobacteriaceae bacterium]